MTSCFLDTSVLLGALIEINLSSEPSRRLWDSIAEGRLTQVQTAWHCCLEFYSVSTRLPEEFRLTPQEALLLIQQEIIARTRIHQLPPTGFDSFFEEAFAAGVAGGRIYDLHIAEVARSASCDTLVTENLRHFDSLSRQGIPVLTAREFLAKLGL